ncbi:MAG TPA: creatininase family protein, partial [Casimicrobiaceae bacterium]
MAALAVRAFACVLLIAAPWTARADAPAPVFLEELTSPELAARIRAGTTTVIIPVGGTEQNGAHMALGKHNVRVRLLS